MPVVAAVAGGLPAIVLDVRPTHAVSAILMHGTEDYIVPIDTGYPRRRGRWDWRRGWTLSR